MATVEQLITEVRVEADTQGIKAVDQAMNALARTEQGLAQANDNLANTSERVTRSTASLETAHSRLKSTFDAAYRAETLYQQQLEKLEAQHRALGVSTAEANRQIDLLAAKYSTAASAAERLEAAARNAARANMQMSGLSSSQAAAQGRALNPMNMSRLSGYGGGGIPTEGIERATQAIQNARNETQMLQYQLFDMGTMLAMGSSPFMIMASQGPQIAQQLGGQGVKGAVSALGTAVMGLLNPVNAAIAGFAGLAIGIGYLWDSWDSGAPTVEESLKRQADLAKQLRDIYGQAAENAAKVVPPDLPEMRFMTGQNLADLQKQSLTDSQAFLNEVGNWTRGGFMADSEFVPFAKQLSDFSKTVVEGRPAIDAFREQIIGMSVVAPDAAAKLRELAAGIIDVNAATKTAAEQDFLAKFDPKALDVAARNGRGYGALNDALMGFRGITDPSAPRPTPNPTRDLTADPAAIKGTNAATEAGYASIMATADQRIAQLRIESATWGMTKEAADAYRIAQTAINDALRDGVSLSDAQVKAIEAKAAVEARAIEAQRQQEELRRQSEEAARKMVEDQKRAAEEASQFWENSLSGALKSLSRGGDPLKILQDIGFKIGDKLIDEGVAEMFGKSKPGGGILSFFTGDKSGTGAAMANAMAAANVGAMTVTAGSVVVSGGLSMPGLGGLPGLTPPASGAAPGSVGTAPLTAVERNALPPAWGQPPIPGLQNAAGGIAALPTARPDTASQALAAMAGGGTFGYRAGVNTNFDPRLLDILKTTAERGGWDAKLISGLRPGDPRFHGKGMAADIALFDKAGNKLDNYQDAGAFRQYEMFAQQARAYQMQKYPELADDLRWGGYFGGPKGKYGALDTMHFDLGGRRVGMAGGSWANGLTDRQLSMFPGAQSIGMAEGGLVPFTGPNVAPVENFGSQLQNVIPPLQQLSSATDMAAGGLGGLGEALMGAVQGGAAGGGQGAMLGLFGGLAKMALGAIDFGGMWNVGNGYAFAGGGYVSGPGSSTSDSIRARLSNGEFVMNAEATRKNRPALEAMNSGKAASRPRDVYLGGHTVSMVFHGKQDESVVEMIDARLAAALEQDNRRRQEMAEYDRQNEWRRG